MNYPNYHMHQKGFSIVELIVAVAITALIVVAVGAFLRNVFFYKSVAQGSLTTAQDARTILKGTN